MLIVKTVKTLMVLATSRDGYICLPLRSAIC